MAKQVVAKVKIQVKGGQATPAPPVGTALGPHGVAIQQFVQQFNDRTAAMKGTKVPVVITIYNDRSFEFVTKSPPAAELLKQAAGIFEDDECPTKGTTGKWEGRSVTRDQVREIAQRKIADLNARDLEHAVKIIEGTARSMGLAIAG